MRTYGTIQHIDHTPGSGLATVVILTDDGDIESVHADAGPLFRALSASRASLGTRIGYDTTDYGTMSAFTVED